MTSAAGRQQANFDRRVAWLEEDVQTLQRRLRDECGDPLNADTADSSLRQLVAHLDGDFAAERRAREATEASMAQLEEEILREGREREAQMHSFSSELESTMGALVARIDESLSSGASSLRERSDVTEGRLRTLIRRVDEGLTAVSGGAPGAAAASGNPRFAQAPVAGSPSRAQPCTLQVPGAGLSSSQRARLPGEPPLAGALHRAFGTAS